MADFGRISQRAGSVLVHQARLLRQLPALAAGMRDGSVSVEQLARVGELVRRIGIEQVRTYDEILGPAPPLPAAA